MTETIAKEIDFSNIDPERAVRLAQTLMSGQDPEMRAAMNKFLKMDDLTEQSNFPTTKTVLCIAQLNGYSGTFFKEVGSDPFREVSDCLSVAFMARKGWKVNSFVDITRQVPAYASMPQQEEPEKRGFFSRGGKTE